MADSLIQVPADSTGKKVDTESLTVGAHTVERQRVQISGAAAADIAPVTAANGLDVDVTRVQGTVTVDPSDRALRDNGKVDISGFDISTADLDSDAGTDTRLTVGIVVPAAGGAAVITGDTGNGLDVDVTRLPSLPAGNNNIGDVDIASGPTGESALQSQGAAAHDAAVAGNPVLIGARANANEPTAVSNDGDAVSLWADLLGRQIVLTGHPSPEAPVTVNGSAAGTSVIAAPGDSLSLYICKGTVHNRAAAETVVSLRDGAAGTIRWTANLAADGGGSLFDFGSRGWKLTSNTALVADIAAASVDVNITEYYIAP